MNQDRELLELAARAADMDLQLDDDGQLLWTGEEFLLPYSATTWNSFQDLGDALRLAVALRLSLMIEDDVVFCQHSSIADVIVRPDEMGVGATLEEATCRAIVCAAAEIQRAKEAA